MPRKKLILHDSYPYHVVNRSNNKEFFYLPVSDLWPIFIEIFYKAQGLYGVSFHAFVLMTNHYHLILGTPNANLSEIMTYIQREVARLANKKANRINHFFGGRYKWSLIHKEQYYWNAIKYIYRNPVESGLCECVGDYAYSSLNSLETKNLWELSKTIFKSEDELQIYTNWFNLNFKNEQRIAIRSALRRREFSLPKNKDGKIVDLDYVRPRKGLGT